MDLAPLDHLVVQQVLVVEVFLGSPGLTTATEVGANGGAGQSCCCFGAASVPGGGGGGGGFLGGGGGGGGSAGTVGCSGNNKVVAVEEPVVLHLQVHLHLL
ncbi:MAG: hypothetical protein IPO02_10720 [Bacteroidetes bacterium]|nr:hypothetical protein [Bacteroidota bacterium]